MAISEKLQPFLDDVRDEVVRSPVKNCEIFLQARVDSFLEAQRNRSMITKVTTLYREGEYERVRQILVANLDIGTACPTKPLPDLTNARLHHLLMMVDTLWSLDEYGPCMFWIEQTIHEVLTSGKDTTDLLNLLKSLECCIVMLDGDMSSIPEEKRPRLVKHIMGLILKQIDGNEECGLGEKTAIAWILVYYMIAFEERSMEEFEDNVPNSIHFLCSAHDYLGPLGLCTLDNGRMLLLLAQKIVDTLIAGVDDRYANDQICKNMDQALFCLFAHPSKKSKVKHLVDHGVSNVTLTWDVCKNPYVFLRPKKIPEYDDLKHLSILQETLIFFRRIIALVPPCYQVEERKKLFKKILASEDDGLPDNIGHLLKGFNEDQKQFPSVMRDLFYLLGDYHFKNGEPGKAIEYFQIDLTLNWKRIDAWVEMALCQAKLMEDTINETDQDNNICEIELDTIKKILAESPEILKCFRRSIEMKPKSVTIRIEGANFAYAMLSFCTRQLSDENVGDLTMDMFSTVEKLKATFMDFAWEQYHAALEMTAAKENAPEAVVDDNADEEEDEGEDNSIESDERWLMYLMKGKILEKQKKAPLEYLDMYMSAVDSLKEQGASLPKKVSFNAPQDLALELLEVYYRIHASVLKIELSEDRFPLPDDDLKKVIALLER